MHSRHLLQLSIIWSLSVCTLFCNFRLLDGQEMQKLGEAKMLPMYVITFPSYISLFPCISYHIVLFCFVLFSFFFVFIFCLVIFIREIGMKADVLSSNLENFLFHINCFYLYLFTQIILLSFLILRHHMNINDNIVCLLATNSIKLLNTSTSHEYKW